MGKNLLFISLFFISINIWGQSSSIDSLKQELSSVSHDTSKVQLLVKIAKAFGEADLDSNLFYRRKALEISEVNSFSLSPSIVVGITRVYTNLNQFQELIAFANPYFELYRTDEWRYQHLVLGSQIGYAYYAIGKRDSAKFIEDYVIQNLDVKDTNERELLVKSLRARASNLTVQSHYAEAITDLERAVQLVDTASYYDLYGINVTIADVYKQFGDYEKALVYYDKANTYVEKSETFYPKMHILYSYADYYREIRQPERAKEYALKGRELTESNNQPYGTLMMNSMLSKCYIDLNQFEEAKPYLKDVVSIGTQFQALQLVAIAQYDLGNVANHEKNYTEAIKQCNMAWEFYENTNDPVQQASVCDCLSDAYQGVGDMKNAFEYYKLAVAYNDSINSEAQIRETYRLQSKYDLERKETEFELDKQKQKLVAAQKLKEKNELILGISIVAMLLLVVGYFVFKSVQRKRETEVAIQKEQAQEQFSQQLLLSQEEEKTRISRELHDSVGQDLILIKSRAKLNNDSELEATISETLQHVREITQGLHPFVLEKFGLTAGLKKLATTADESTDIFISEEIEDIDGNLTKQQELGVYRIAQEAINNIIKHAETPSALISAKKANGFIELMIKDHGKGFDWSEKSNAKNSLGMKTLQERAKMLNASLAIESETNKGTTIHLKIPINS